jgi:predicted transcriptional regulator
VRKPKSLANRDKPSGCAVSRTFLEDIRDNVKSRRLELGLSQKDLSLAAGLNEFYVSQLEQLLLNITVGSLESIAKALQTTEEALVHRRER